MKKFVGHGTARRDWASEQSSCFWSESRYLDSRRLVMDKDKLLGRITTNPEIFGGKPIIRGHRLAVEHVLEMLDAGDTPEDILEGYDWLQPEDIEACLVFAGRPTDKEGHQPSLYEAGA
jgi:uncharacterized protein (DUF433 family)